MATTFHNTTNRRPALARGGKVWVLERGATAWREGDVSELYHELGQRQFEHLGEAQDGARPPALAGIYEPEGDMGSMQTARRFATRSF